MLPEFDHPQLPRNCRLLVLPEETTGATPDMFADLPDVNSAQQAAKAIGVCDKHIRELAAQGKIKGFRVGRLWRFTKQSLIDFVEGGGTNGQR